jgi:hypothetical protein
MSRKFVIAFALGCLLVLLGAADAFAGHAGSEQPASAALSFAQARPGILISLGLVVAVWGLLVTGTRSST